MLYYGPGCKITKIGNWNLSRDISAESSKITVENILINGINAIPWKAVSELSSGKNIEIQEYQYINLTAGDLIKNLGVEGDITSNYIPVTTAETVAYRLSSELDDDSIPPHNLPTIAVSEFNWEIASRLQLNVNAQLSQKLRILKLGTCTLTDSIKLNYVDGMSEYDEIVPMFSDNNEYLGDLAIKTNKVVQSGNIETFVGTTIYKGTESQIEYKYDLVVGVSKEGIIQGSEGTTITLHNFGENGLWTQIKSDLLKPNETFPLNVNIPDDCFGLIMFYYNTSQTLPEKQVKVQISEYTDEGELPKLAIYNNVDNNEKDVWWSTVSDNKYPLKKGINIVKIPHTVRQLTIIPESEESPNDIIFSNLDCVYTNAAGDRAAEINLAQIGYRAVSSEINDNTEEENAAKQLLRDIRNIDSDHYFYYNTVLDNSNVIDLSSAEQDSERSSLAKPRIFYDYNNINNKFVISEISADDMRKGITIAQSSKL